MPKSLDQASWERANGPFRTPSKWPSTGRTAVEKKIWKKSLSHDDWEKVPSWECFFHRQTQFFFISKRRRHEHGWTNSQLGAVSGKWSSALVIFRCSLLSRLRWWVMVRCRILVGGSGRTVALLLCQVRLWFLMWVRLLLLL